MNHFLFRNCDPPTDYHQSGGHESPLFDSTERGTSISYSAPNYSFLYLVLLIYYFSVPSSLCQLAQYYALSPLFCGFSFGRRLLCFVFNLWILIFFFYNFGCPGQHNVYPIKTCRISWAINQGWMNINI